MGKIILVLGESGTGKSTSIRSLDPKETFIINIMGKDLPFKGSKKIYLEGKNMISTHNHADILPVINKISSNMPHIKNVVLDDFHYVMASEFMNYLPDSKSQSNSQVKGNHWDKYNDMAKHTWEIIQAAVNSRNDLCVFILMHGMEENGIIKPKTVGKLTDRYAAIESFCTAIFHTVVVNDKPCFLTQHDGYHMARAPMGMLDDKYCDNDLKYVKQKMFEFFDEDPTLTMENA